MIKQEIETKAKAKSVAKELADDLLKSVEIYGGYAAEINEEGKPIRVEFYSYQNCAIITDSVFMDAYKVIQMYMLKYEQISFWLDSTELNGKHIPMIVINVSWSK